MLQAFADARSGSSWESLLKRVQPEDCVGGGGVGKGMVNIEGLGFRVQLFLVPCRREFIGTWMGQHNKQHHRC